MTKLVVILDSTATSDDPTLNLVRAAHARGDLAETTSLTIAGCPEGTSSGKPTVLFLHDVGGTPIFCETTLALFLTAADALKAKYGDPR